MNKERYLVFFEITVDDVVLGRLVILLFGDICPKICSRFRCLCTGELGPHYRHSKVHKIVKGFALQGGKLKSN
eukprot:UN03604